MRVVVSWDLCEANARCMDACPEVFKVDDKDELHILIEQPPEALRAKLKAAVAACPRAAIMLVED